MNQPTSKQQPARHGLARATTRSWAAPGGLIAIALCTLTPLAALAAEAGAAPSLSIVYQFKGAPDGASWAATALTAAGDGGLLGVTESGGTATDPFCDASVGPGCGTLFRLDSSGGVTVLHNFGVDKGDGKTPMSPPLADGAGNLYGTFNEGGRYGYGGVYKIDASGQQTIVHAFLGGAGDGTNPAGNLVRDAAGNIYGTTPAGGKGICRSISDVGCGTVWKVDTSGKYSVYYQFRNYEDGYRPNSLAIDAEGNLIGTSTFGGTDIQPDVCPHGCGVVFKISPSGKKSTLHDFMLVSDGAWPQGPVAQDAAGNFHSTAQLGGPAGATGTVWRLTPKGKFKLRAAFTGSNGAKPMGPVAMDAEGNLFGTTFAGGNTSCYGDGCGVVWALDAANVVHVLHRFGDGEQTEGIWPRAGVTLGADGALYGQSYAGHDANGNLTPGTLWRIAR